VLIATVPVARPSGGERARIVYVAWKSESSDELSGPRSRS
jgi:hypothetical protein